MHLRFSFNSNNLNAQVNSNHKWHNLNIINRIMHRGLPVEVSIESVDFGSSKSEFETSVNSAVLTWASEEISPSGSWMSSYVPSANDVVSICNAIFEN